MEDIINASGGIELIRVTANGFDYRVFGIPPVELFRRALKSNVFKAQPDLIA